MEHTKNVFQFHFTLVIVLCCIGITCYSQSQDSIQESPIHKKRLKAFVITSSVAYGASLAGLNQLWYKNSGRQSFRFFNDNAEWKQIDKAGHFYASFYLSYGTSKILNWCKVTPKKSDLAAALTGFLVLVPIEIFDGYSPAYGASAGDLIADAAGPLFFLGQKTFWKEIRIQPKISFHHTSYAALNPKLLGDNNLSEIFKDYNGQTYWFSFDMDKFMTFPKWLNLAVGYGAQNMINARDQQNVALGYSPYRQYYFSIDIDPTAIRTKSKVVKTLIMIVSAIKLPAPTLEFSKHGSRFKPFYF
jgi:hypothetical protein